MECVGYTIKAEVPPELSSAATCTTAFFKMASTLEQLEGQEAVRKHTLFMTGRGHLVEVEGSKVQRSAFVAKSVTKIVVHHDFEPRQLYIVLLVDSGSALLLAYTDFKILQKWKDVKDIASADSLVTGAPQLTLTKLDDSIVVMSNAQLMSRDCGEEQKEEETGVKKEAVQALMHRFKGGVKLAGQLRMERKMKESFIAEELVALHSQLEGRLNDREESLVPTLSLDEGKPNQKENVECVSGSPLKVLRVHHKLVHDKWVVGVSVINERERVLVSDLELVMCCGETLLCHTSQALRMVKHSRPQAKSDMHVTIEHLEPPVLRPMKKATVVAVCEMPSFESGPCVSCHGLLSYTGKPLKPSNNQSVQPGRDTQVQRYQVSVPMVELKAGDLHSHLASFEHNNSSAASVTFSTVALVAASKQTHVCLTSLVSPLTTFIERVASKLQIKKGSGLSDFYIVHCEEYHPLQHCGFTLHSIDSHALNLTLYSRDEKQAVVLAHSLLAALPEDASMQLTHRTKDSSRLDAQPTNLHHTLLAKMRETAAFVAEGLEARLGGSKAPRMDRKDGSKEARNKENEGYEDFKMETKDGREELRKEGSEVPRVEREEGSRVSKDMFVQYAKEREELLARKGDVTFTAEEYTVWRKKLQDTQTEVDSLYLKFLKLHCASDK